MATSTTPKPSGSAIRRAANARPSERMKRTRPTIPITRIITLAIRP